LALVEAGPVTALILRHLGRTPKAATTAGAPLVLTTGDAPTDRSAGPAPFGR